MKFLRLTVLALTFSSFSFAVNKDLLALQRDLDTRLDALQNAQSNLSTQIATLAGTLNAMQNDTRRTADQIAGMQDVLRNTVANSLTPISGLNTKVETTSEDVRALRDALADLSGRLERMDAKITDLKNQLQIMQNPPSAPGATPDTGMPPGAGNPLAVPGQQGGAANTGMPPPGVSADKTYTDARRDQQAGDLDLALKEYQQYLAYFPNTELAPSAQYYIGEIAYNRGDYTTAISAFNNVSERYPQNPKTRDALLMKGLAYAKSGQRAKAAQELRSLIRQFPTSEQARRAQADLRDPSLFPSAAPTRRR